MTDANSSEQGGPSGAVSPALVSRPEVTFYPLSLGQRDIWLQCQLYPERSSYKLCMMSFIAGPLDVALFQRAFAATVQRQEMLRTVFTVEDGIVMQRTVSAISAKCPLHDLNGTEQCEEGSVTRHWTRQLLTFDFDLEMGPLFRAALLRFAPQRHAFLLCFHRLILDGFCAAQILRETVERYERYRLGKPELPPSAFKFRDFAVWQQERLTGNWLEENSAHWLRQLREPLPKVDLPADRLPHADRIYEMGSYTFKLESAVSNTLRDLARQQRVTVFEAVLAAFSVLLFRLSGSPDLLIGVPLTVRPREMADVAGAFGNLFPLRIEICHRQSFLDLLADVDKRFRQAGKHREFSLTEVLRFLKTKRDPKRALFSIIVSQMGSVNTRIGEFDLFGWGAISKETLHDFSLSFLEEPDGISLFFAYALDLFDEPSVARWMKCFSTLLQEIVQHPEVPLSGLNILTADERDRVVEQSLTVAQQRSPHWNPVDLFEQQAVARAESIAIAAERRVTYGDLNRQANRVAHWLLKVGVGSGDLVPILAPPSIEMVVAILGVLKAGGAYALIEAGLDPACLRTRLDELSAHALLATGDRAKELNTAGLVRVPVLRLDRTATELADTSEDNPASTLSPMQPASVVYPSVSAECRGVLIPPRALARRAGELEQQDAILMVSPCIAAASFELWGALLSGARIVLPQASWSLPALAALLRKESVTVLQIPPDRLAQALEEIPEALRDLRVLVTGGDVAPAALLREAINALPGTLIVHEYGTAEAPAAVSWPVMEAIPEDAETVPIGRPSGNCAAYVLDSHGNVLPPGVRGELYLAGDALALGYLGDPEQTAARFPLHPFQHGSRVFRTGDRARWRADGLLELDAPSYASAKKQGRRVEFAAIEKVLAAFPGVAQAVVVVRRGSTGKNRVEAYLEKCAGVAAIDPGAVLELARSQLPEYLVPDCVVVTNELPRDASGAPDREALLARSTHTADASCAAVPESALEHQLVAIWEEELDCRPIGVEDNLLQLGAHSLNMVSAHRRMMNLLPRGEESYESQRELARQFPMRVFFEHPTIRSLASILERLIDCAPIGASA
jgi:non-ribosomal peptide synthetase component F